MQTFFLSFMRNEGPINFDTGPKYASPRYATPLVGMYVCLVVCIISYCILDHTC